MSHDRYWLEQEFLRICRVRGRRWIESVLRPLRLKPDVITARDIPTPALMAIVRGFGGLQEPARDQGVTGSSGAH
jgi:hypothetical protein